MPRVAKITKKLKTTAKSATKNADGSDCKDSKICNDDTPDGRPRMYFDNATSFRTWLDDNHCTSTGIWLMIPKKGCGGNGPTYPEAVDDALCYGWIDSQIRKVNDQYYMQKFTPRLSKSKWSKINCKKISNLIKTGKMQQAGLNAVNAAKEDGRWDNAYDSPKTITVPNDFQKALEDESTKIEKENKDGGSKKNKSTTALEFFESLSSSNRYSILYYIHDAKRLETRQKRIDKYVAMCSRNEKPK